MSHDIHAGRQAGRQTLTHFHIHSRFCDAFVTWNIVGIDGSFQIQQYLCEVKQRSCENPRALTRLKLVDEILK